MSDDFEAMKQKIEEFRRANPEHFCSSDKEIEDIILGRVNTVIASVKPEIDEMAKIRRFKDKLIGAMKEAGGPELDIDFLISDEGEPAIKLIGKTLAKQNQDYPILKVDYSKTFWELLEEGGVDYVEIGEGVGPKFFTIKPRDETKLVLAYVHDEKIGNTGLTIEQKLKEQGFRVADFAELMAYVKKMRNLIDPNRAIYALGTRAVTNSNYILGIGRTADDNIKLLSGRFNSSFSGCKILVIAE